MKTKRDWLILLQAAKTKSDIGFAIDHIEAYHPVGLYSHMLTKAECVAAKEKLLEKHKELLKNETV